MYTLVSNGAKTDVVPKNTSFVCPGMKALDCALKYDYQECEHAIEEGEKKFHKDVSGPRSIAIEATCFVLFTHPGPALNGSNHVMFILVNASEPCSGILRALTEIGAETCTPAKVLPRAEFVVSATNKRSYEDKDSPDLWTQCLRGFSSHASTAKACAVFASGVAMKGKNRRSFGATPFSKTHSLRICTAGWLATRGMR